MYKIFQWSRLDQTWTVKNQYPKWWICTEVAGFLFNITSKSCTQKADEIREREWKKGKKNNGGALRLAKQRRNMDDSDDANGKSQMLSIVRQTMWGNLLFALVPKQNGCTISSLRAVARRRFSSWYLFGFFSKVAPVASQTLPVFSFAGPKILISSSWESKRLSRKLRLRRLNPLKHYIEKPFLVKLSFLEDLAEVFHALFLVCCWGALEHACFANLTPPSEEDIQIFVGFIDQPQSATRRCVCEHWIALNGFKASLACRLHLVCS